MEHFNKQGIVNMCILMLYDALKENANITTNVILSNAQYIVETNTGVTLNAMKNYISSSYKEPFNRAEMLNDVSQNMSVKEIAKKWGRTESSIRSYLNRQKIEYRNDHLDEESIANELRKFNGLCTCTEMGIRTHHATNVVRRICKTYQVPYRERG